MSKLILDAKLSRNYIYFCATHILLLRSDLFLGIDSLLVVINCINEQTLQIFRKVWITVYPSNKENKYAHNFLHYLTKIIKIQFRSTSNFFYVIWFEFFVFYILIGYSLCLKWALLLRENILNSASVWNVLYK